MSDLPPPTSTLDSKGDRPRRRPRYSGKNPRRFAEKYKELDPAKYPEVVAKLVAGGKTPVGTHRPILVSEIRSVLALQPGNRVVDCTLGYGGHARELMPDIRPGGHWVGLDIDPIEQPKTVARLREAGFGEDIFTAIRRNFAGLPQVLVELGWEGADAILADLGVSSMQWDDPSRGFTFKDDGPLDLRLNPQRPPSAAHLLATLSAEKLAILFEENADEPKATVLAAGLVRARAVRPIERTGQLADCIRDILAHEGLSRDRDSDALCIRRVFQALRIAVNDEFGALEALLRHLPLCLKPGGRVCFLTFHSGEDRRVKKAFQAGERAGLYGSVAEEVIRAGPEEVRSNPRSSSAKLRWAIRGGQ
jgi:16S rRNA (cytosine1402-N4)-methyltransferase